MFQRATLIGMWVIPIGFCLKFGWMRFIVIWAIFSVITAFIVFKATRKPLGGRTPRYVDFVTLTYYLFCMILLNVTCYLQKSCHMLPFL